MEFSGRQLGRYPVLRLGGLGDVVEKVIDTVTLGMAKKAVEKSGKDCGCKKRRAALNRIGRTDKKSD